MATQANDGRANDRQALVLGATGGIGGELTDALLARGWRIRALTRDVARAAKGRDPRIDWIAGDAMDGPAVAAAAQGCDLVVHAVNPPGYRDWDKLVLPMLDNAIAAARAAGARVLLPGTVYNYGPDAFPVLREDSPQHPRSRKGAIRVAMEQRLAEAAQAGVPVLIVRAGDFFGGRAAANNWFSQGLVKPGKPLRAVVNPGRRGVAHAWAYLPDLAQAMAELLDKAPAEGLQAFHFAGHLDADGARMGEAVRRASGRPGLPARPFPWLLVSLLSPFVALFREMGEMRYLWRTPLSLDNARLVQALGREPHTPLDEAVARTLRDLGCLG
jgi:nucleoside-diphosphate-sugar epimerase